MKHNFIFIIVDSISYKYSWLNNEEFMPKLFKMKNEFKNFHNHFSTARNTRGAFASILSGLYPNLHKVNNRKHSFRSNKYGYLQKHMQKYGYRTFYYGTQPLFHSEKKNDNLDFNESIYLSPSMAEYFIPALNYNKSIKKKLTSISNKPYFLFLHYTDVHAPYETPNINFLSPKYKNIRNFLIKNFFNLNIPRRFRSLYLSQKNFNLDNVVYNDYPNLKNDCINPRGRWLTPERYPKFYDAVWSNDAMYNEYIDLMRMCSLYQDHALYEFLNYFKQENSKNNIIILVSDHTNNDIYPPMRQCKTDFLLDKNLQIPMSILSFDKEITKKLKLVDNEYTYTSHIDFYNSFLSIFDNEYEDNDYEINLMNVKKKDRFLLAQMFDSRQDHNQFRMFNENDSINFFMKPSDIVKDIISKNEIMNDIDDYKYSQYIDYVSGLNNKVLDKRGSNEKN
tara:strand:+ start:7242 stop:8591 length:1350 start_codon:yes stop_codon:yes gene_type:complete